MLTLAKFARFPLPTFSPRRVVSLNVGWGMGRWAVYKNFNSDPVIFE